MKHNYLFFQRSLLAYVIAVWLVTLCTNLASAQQRAELDAGVIRIKATEQLAQQLESARITRSASNDLITGIKSLDAVNAKYKASAIKRVFRDAGKFEAKHKKYGLHLWYEIQVDKAAPILSALDAYKSLQSIQRVEPSYKKAVIGSERADYGPRIVDPKGFAATLPGASNDPMLQSQWHYNNTGQAGGTPGSDISLFQAWGLTTGTPDIIVAVTDGGAQVDHPDLAPNMWVNVDEIPGNDLDDDDNGFVDDVNGYGFGDDTGEIFPDDHGTHTSGTIAAVTNNGVGVAGVAGGSGTGDGARIMTLAAFGGVGTGGFAESYIYGADNGAVISQNSWGYTSPGVFEQAVLDAIDYFIAEAGKDDEGNQIGPMRGGIVIFAAGNSDSNEQYYPGFYESTLAVSGVTNQDKKAWYSNFGEWVDIAAPGGETFVDNDPQGVLSTVANGQYAFYQGTSMACPHVSGVAALIISKFGGTGFTPEMLRGRLTQLVDDIDAADPDFAGLLGSGRLNAFSALQEDDGDAPDAITDLEASDVAITSIKLSWTSPADPGNGSASAYDIRYSTSPINEGNFASATAVADPPAPSPAGSTDSLTISGLAPGTMYYFAIKSADFFGNYSAISNVLEQATNFPPVISVSPTSLTENLVTAATSTQTLTISNTGLGVLNFFFDGINPDGFVDVVPSSGSVPAGGSLDLDVTFDATDLFPGTYSQTLFISSNDPAADSLSVAVTLNVTSNGQPIASVQPDSLDFGQIFETGSKTLPLTIHNAGAEPLIITGIASDNSDFTTDFSGTDTLDAFEDRIVYVKYIASALGVSSGNLTISTNDPANPSLSVSVTGEGVVAPTIEVTPSSLSESLNTDKESTQTLTISNNGGSDLVFAIEVSAGTPGEITPTAASVKDISIPVKSQIASGAGQKTAAPDKKYPNQIKLRSVAKSAAETQVLIITPDDDVTDIESILDAFDDIEADVYGKDSLPGITLADLDGYDIVFTTNNTQWLQSGGVEPSVIGDLLADYIDDGGKVIVNQFAYSYDAWQMTGRFIDEQYGPFTPSTADENIDTELGTILLPDHPIVEGVSDLLYSGYVQNVGLAAGAVAIAEWETGDLFIAANGSVVALNMLPSLGNAGGLAWEGDLPTIYQNSVHYLAGPSYVRVDPTEGVVTPGSQIELEVTFDASGLDAGVYPADINITNNAPNHELVVVPAVLTVLGPEFTVSPTSLSESLPKDATSTQTIVLSNNGPDDHSFTVSVPGGIVSTAIVRNDKSSGRQATSVKPGEKAKQSSAAKSKTDFSSKMLAGLRSNASAKAAVAPASTGQYVTDFEEFDLGDIDGQNGWYAQWGNWTVETDNPSSGSQHFRGLADGLGFSYAVTPLVPIGAEDKSTTTMKVNVQGTGVTWQIIPESPTAGLVNTRIQFAPDGSVAALVDDGAGGAVFETFAAATPAGYFDLTIEVDRGTSEFKVLFDEATVFTGQGFTGDIEEVVILSLMEVAGPTFDVDDLQIIDGTNEDLPEFIAVSPESGNLPSGASAVITVTFNSADLEFGTYSSAVKFDIDGAILTVPASLRVFGDPNIAVDPTVLAETVDYKGSATQNIEIKNTGGNPLTYSMQVIGANTDVAKLPPGPVSKLNRMIDKRTQEKKAIDDRDSKPVTAKPSKIELFAGTALLQENFEGASFPPAGWGVVDNEGSGVVWNFAAAYEDGNYCGTGEAATVNSDASGTVEFDTELITPSVSTAGYKNIVVQYNVNYQNYAGLDFLDLDIQVDGGAWTTVLNWNEDHGTLFGTGEFVTVPLETYLDGASSFRLRWHYYDPNTDDWDWYAQVDDITILGDARAWLSVSPASGTVPVQESADIAADFDASDLDPGFYVAGIVVSSNAPTTPLVGIVASLDVREPAEISVAPGSLYQELNSNEQATQTLTITNSGESALKFGFGNTPVPAAVKVVTKDRIATSVRTEPSKASLDRKGTKAITSGVSRTASTPLYVTGFEEFATGNINGQESWAGQYGNWTVETDNPYEADQHFRGLSDGLGQSLAFSPEVAIGTDPISSTAMQINVDTGSTWQIIPQSLTAGLVNTRFEIARDGKLSALVSDGAGGGFYEPINAILPTGYFEFRIDVDRATSMFTIFFDGTEIFTGQGFAGDIEQVVMFSLMEEDGQNFDVDNFAIFDGPGKASWLSYNPKSGIVPAGESATITIGFNAEDLAGGFYYDTLEISSNDPDNSHVVVPVTLEVNSAPVIAEIDSAIVIELGSLNVTFSATDPEGSPVTVVLNEGLAFVNQTSTSNGTATYSIRPRLGDGGEYDLPVTATDASGASASAIFHLSVIPYGVEDFSLVIATTNQTLLTSDTIEVDVANPDFSKYTIRANTNPAVVGSVRFWVDNQFVNTENDGPYILNPAKLAQLSGGEHTILARSYTKASAGGSQGSWKSAVIRIINSTKVTDFDVVKHPNTKLIDLADSATIDISQNAYKKINVKANTLGSTIKSVVFTLNGSNFRYDNASPYMLNGVNGGSDLVWPAAPGWYTLTATPYSKFNGQGVAGESHTVVFRVANGLATGVAGRSAQPEIMETGTESFVVYPVPVRDDLRISLQKETKGRVGLVIRSAQGQALYTDDGQAEKFQDYRISTNALGLKPGIYVIQVQLENGRREIRKFIKE